ncbi:uncharacterized protein LOC106169960 [Lingula anatina]|uniref:Uncharacterized protein LOC106169960 n=1 Tax=Lingula anatina TaxID=7574 RepID=A0A1S3J3W8_LINAN|nr:uncharacterized protein LOC106169960 [Lingula anatina]|eukprot:XP_013405095.2 uncharacterized protein LOC106169960 [Lingula anatina]
MLNDTLKAALAPSTQRTYMKIEPLLDQFAAEIGQPAFPTSPSITALFAQSLAKKYKPSSIKTLMSALSYKYKIRGYDDPTSSFIVRQTLRGLSRLQPTMDDRRPLTLEQLRHLLQTASQQPFSQYHACLFRAMFTTAFFGLFRISEITGGSKDNNHTIRIQYVNLDLQKGTIIITLPSFKHSSNTSNHQVTLFRQNPAICPVEHLAAYLHMRPQSSHSELFLQQDGSLVTRHHFTDTLKHCLQAAGMDTTLTKSHSFRIGGATLAAKCGMSTEQIRILGRWRSSAFTNYIRF